ncbi:hypothetical protein D3C83_196470 [compost metagenome]
MDFARSHLRIERFVAEGAESAALTRIVSDFVQAHGFVTIFTHEICFGDPRTRETLQGVVAICDAMGLASA